MADGRAIDSRVAEDCMECGRLCELRDGLAEYHPYEFCRVVKAGGDPWNGRKPLNIYQVDAVLKATLQQELRYFWRARFHTEVTLP